MTQPEPASQPAGDSGEGIMKVLRIRPGLSSGDSRSLKIILPEDKIGCTIQEAIRYAIQTAGQKASQRDLLERVQHEMSGSYDITVHGEKVAQDTPLQKYFVRKETEENKIPYDEAELTVAADHSGGLEYLL